MKKLLLTIFALFTIFSFSSCDLLMQILFPTEYEPVEFTVPEKGDTYFVKYVLQPGYYYNGRSSGYISDARNVVAETQDEIDLPKIGGANLNDTQKITELNKKIDSLMAQDNRAAKGSISCTTEKDDSYVGKISDFWIIKEYTSKDSQGNTVTNQGQVLREAVCKYTGEHCNVWFIDNYVDLPREFSDSDFSALGQKFDILYESETAVVGSTIYNTKSAINYINPKDKVQIIVLDCMEDAYEGMSGGVFGYFYSMDVFSDDYNFVDETTGQETTYYTNRDFVIYLDSLFYSYDETVTITDSNGNSYVPNCKDSMFSTIAHEFNHLLNYIQKQIVNGVRNNDTWFTEMLAMTMEDFFMEYLNIDPEQSSRGRLYYYFNNYHNYGPTTWFNGDSVYISYANAFALGAYLSRNYGGADFIHEVATNDKGGIDAINAALSKFGYNERFEDVIRKMPNILINTSSSGITLNKSADSKNYKNVSITPINLVHTIQTQSGTYTYKPNLLDKRAYGGDIYPYGYSIYDCGRNISTITYMPTSDDYKEYLEFGIIVK